MVCITAIWAAGPPKLTLQPRVPYRDISRKVTPCLIRGAAPHRYECAITVPLFDVAALCRPRRASDELSRGTSFKGRHRCTTPCASLAMIVAEVDLASCDIAGLPGRLCVQVRGPRSRRRGRAERCVSSARRAFECDEGMKLHSSAIIAELGAACVIRRGSNRSAASRTVAAGTNMNSRPGIGTATSPGAGDAIDGRPLAVHSLGSATRRPCAVSEATLRAMR